MEIARIEQIDEEPVFLVTFNPEARADEWSKVTIALVREQIERLNAYIYVVADARDLKADFVGMLSGLSDVRSDNGRFISGKVTAYLVGSGKLFEVASNAIGQGQYGGFKFVTSTSVEEAIARAQEEHRSNGWRPLDL